MKKFIFLLLLLPMFSYPQYQSIFGTTSTSWNVMVENTATNMFETDSIVAGIDTLINSLSYKKISFYELDHTSPTPPLLLGSAFIREETDMGKAWIAFWKAGTFYEFLFFDLSLQLGDSVNIYGNYYHVDSIYTKDGLKHVRIAYWYTMLTMYPRNTGELTFIEGIGTTFGFTYQTEEINWFPDSHTTPYQLCSYKDGNQVYYHNNPAPFFEGCYHRLIIEGVKTDLQTIAVYPNPVSHILTVGNASISSPEIFNHAGIRMELPFSKTGNTLFVNVESLTRGMYFIRINSRFYKFIRH